MKDNNISIFDDCQDFEQGIWGWSEAPDIRYAINQIKNDKNKENKKINYKNDLID